MAVLATSNSITLSTVVDINGYYRYYLLQSSTAAVPAKPTAYPPTGGWTDTEPTYTSGSTNSLYIVDCTEFNDGTWEYSDVSLSSSYEAAKAAYNRAVAAGDAASAAQATADSKADPMTATAHGSEIVVSDSADAAIGGLVIYGKSTQNGTPTPASPVDIVTAGSGGTLQIVTTGKNVLEDNVAVGYTFTSNGVTVTKNADGSYTLNGTATSSMIHIGNFALSAPTLANQNDEKLHVRPGTYTASGLVNGVALQICASNVAGISSLQVPSAFTNTNPTTTVSTDYKYNWGRLYIYNGATFNNTVIRPMLRPSEIADDTWEPYKAAVTALPTPNGLPGIKVSSGGNYTDADGQQWVCDTIDLAAGTYTKRCGMTTFGALTWDSTTHATYGTYFRAAVTGLGILREGAFPTTAHHALTSHYQIVARGSLADKLAVLDGTTTQVTQLQVKDSTYSTADSFKAAMSNVPFVYLLATPVTTPLTEAQLTALRSIRTRAGGTVMTNDAGADMDLVYATQTGGGSYVEGVRQGLDDDVNRAQAAADAAQASADAAAATADALDEIFRMWYSFTDEGMIVQKKREDGSSASIWSTVTDNIGFHIRREDLLDYVFSAYRDRCKITKLEIGDLMIKPSGSGGMVWVKK